MSEKFTKIQFNPLKYPKIVQLDEYYLTVFQDCYNMIQQGKLLQAQTKEIQSMIQENACFFVANQKGGLESILNKLGLRKYITQDIQGKVQRLPRFKFLIGQSPQTKLYARVVKVNEQNKCQETEKYENFYLVHFYNYIEGSQYVRNSSLKNNQDKINQEQSNLFDNNNFFHSINPLKLDEFQYNIGIDNYNLEGKPYIKKEFYQDHLPSKKVKVEHDGIQKDDLLENQNNKLILGLMGRFDKLYQENEYMKIEIGSLRQHLLHVENQNQNLIDQVESIKQTLQLQQQQQYQQYKSPYQDQQKEQDYETDSSLKLNGKNVMVIDID